MREVCLFSQYHFQNFFFFCLSFLAKFWKMKFHIQSMWGPNSWYWLGFWMTQSGRAGICACAGGTLLILVTLQPAVSSSKSSSCCPCCRELRPPTLPTHCFWPKPPWPALINSLGFWWTGVWRAQSEEADRKLSHPHRHLYQLLCLEHWLDF